MDALSLPTLIPSTILAGVVSYLVAVLTGRAERRVGEELSALGEYARAIERARRACFQFSTTSVPVDRRLEEAARIGEALTDLGQTIDCIRLRLPTRRRTSAEALSARLGAIMGFANQATDVESFFANIHGLERMLEAEREAVEADRARIVGH